MSRGATAGAPPAMDVDVVVDVDVAPLEAIVVAVAREPVAGTVVDTAAGTVVDTVTAGLVPTEGGFHPRSVVPAHWPVSRLLSRPHSL